jgi:hypothetical protein
VVIVGSCKSVLKTQAFDHGSARGVREVWVAIKFSEGGKWEGAMKVCMGVTNVNQEGLKSKGGISFVGKGMDPNVI